MLQPWTQNQNEQKPEDPEMRKHGNKSCATRGGLLNIMTTRGCACKQGVIIGWKFRDRVIPFASLFQDRSDCCKIFKYLTYELLQLPKASQQRSQTENVPHLVLGTWAWINRSNSFPDLIPGQVLCFKHLIPEKGHKILSWQAHPRCFSPMWNSWLLNFLAIWEFSFL